MGKRQKSSKWAPTLNATTTKHDVVRRAAQRLNMPLTDSDTAFSVYWTDGVVTLAKMLSLKPWQRINHFPGMHNICHKNYLAKNLHKMRKLFPRDYAFWPRTWCVDTEFPALSLRFNSTRKRRRWYIAKPDAKSKGIGIYLFSRLDELDRSEPNMIVQEYIHRPFTVDGYKLDMRVYVLVTSCEPLQVFVYKAGLARFATEKYQPPTDENREAVCMHLTNYSINRKSTKFVDGGEHEGSKRTLQWLWSHLDSQGHSSGAVWASIKDIIVKTMITVQPELAKAFRSSVAASMGSPCFELLGFDIMLDHCLRPYVIEVNHSPSLSCETKVDYATKDALLDDVFRMLRVPELNPKKWTRRERRQAKARLYAPRPTSPKPDETQQRQDSVLDVSRTAEVVVDTEPEDADDEDDEDEEEEVPSVTPEPTPPSATETTNPPTTDTDTTTSTGGFERAYPPPDNADPVNSNSSLSARYAKFLAAATQSLFTIGETNAQRARKSIVLLQQQQQQQQKSPSSRPAPAKRSAPRSAEAAGRKPAPSAPPDTAASIARHLHRRAARDTSRSTLKLSVGMLGALSPSPPAAQDDAEVGRLFPRLRPTATAIVRAASPPLARQRPPAAGASLVTLALGSAEGRRGLGRKEWKSEPQVYRVEG
ncbi:Tubulin polyglutamylase ttll6 [Sorochytrium milnesiophthora]